MSSNTLRGIGQEGGDGEDEAPAGASADGGDPAVAKEEPADRLPELRRMLSLDATVPGARSLDGSVPEATPSPDAKVPNLQATLVGLPTPLILGRGQGTIQGRDVHLPSEARRNAGLRAVAGMIAHSAAGEAGGPKTGDDAEETVHHADWRTDTEERKTAADGQVHRQAPSDLRTNPWYDDDLAGHRVYDQEGPNVLGRVAIGAAAAAALAVLLFAFVRIYRQDPGPEEADLQGGAMTSPPAPTTQIVRPPLTVPATPAPPPPESTSTPPAPAADDLAADLEASRSAAAAKVSPPNSPRKPTADHHQSPTASSEETSVAVVPAAAREDSAPRAPTNRAIATSSPRATNAAAGSTTRPGASAIGASKPPAPDLAPAGPRFPPLSSVDPPPISTAPPAPRVEAATAPRAPSASATETTPPTPLPPPSSSSASKTPPSERRAKPSYDPDSTLPLNLE